MSIRSAGPLSADSAPSSASVAAPSWHLAVIAGCAAMLIGAIAWAAITVATEHQIGWIALGVGALVGWVVSFGKGGRVFGLLGALLALMGCVLGNFLSIVALAVTQQKIGVSAALTSLDYAKVAALMWDGFLSTPSPFTKVIGFRSLDAGNNFFRFATISDL